MTAERLTYDVALELAERALKPEHRVSARHNVAELMMALDASIHGEPSDAWQRYLAAADVPDYDPLPPRGSL